MQSIRPLLSIPLAVGLLCFAIGANGAPLTVHPQNPRYFTDGSGKAIYLAGSNYGFELQDQAWEDNVTFNFSNYLNFLAQYNMNWIRLWRVEHTAAQSSPAFVATPMPYRRSGPENAIDGRPKFDLTQFDQVYFNRLRSRIIAARDRGIFVGIMLFESWGTRNTSETTNFWNGNPFNSANNVNGVNGDTNGDGIGPETHTMATPQVRAFQEAYVKQVIDTVNDLDNVLYEIANESQGTASKDWQSHMANVIKEYEAGKPKQHPVYISTWPGGFSNNNLWGSPADVVGPGRGWGSDYIINPPAASGKRVVIMETDHNDPENTNPQTVWKNFLRGNSVSVLDGGLLEVTGSCCSANPVSGNWGPIRDAMKHTRAYAVKVNLAAMTPRGDLSSTRYALANPGSEYLVYAPGGGSVSVNVRRGTYDIEWMQTSTGQVFKQTAQPLSGNQTLTPPFGGDALLYLLKTGSVTPPPWPSPKSRPAKQLIFR